MYQQGLAAYRQSAINTIQDPKKLIKMLFEKAIIELNLAKENITIPGKLSKHLGKVIAIIGELQSGINFEKGGEAAQFLYGLYGAIIKELSKINGKDNSHLETIDRAIRYLTELKRIWEEQVLHNDHSDRKDKDIDVKVANL